MIISGSLDDDEKWEAFKKGMKNATKKTHDVQDLAINGLFVLRKGSSRDFRP
jgi:hypothetical protein